jgi:SAM-dependent methyltransferase
MNMLELLSCPRCGGALVSSQEGALLRCGAGHEHPVVRGIPRFVPEDNYARSFGLQWNVFRQTQLDSHTGTTISRDRLARLLGGSMEPVRGKLVLEAGCGAGRFTEVMLDAGARVMAVDISSAVEANQANCGHRPGHAVAQADIEQLPFAPGGFDVVVCIGVLQATPDPERAIAALCAQLKPGGLLVIDHYTYGYATTPSRAALRKRLLGRSPEDALRTCLRIQAVLWPAHRLLWALRKLPGMARLRERFLHFSPLVDYHEHYGQIGKTLLRQWAVLDMHDTVTDVFKHLRGVDEIAACLRGCGMVEVRAWLGGNGVEASARKGAEEAA